LGNDADLFRRDAIEAISVEIINEKHDDDGIGVILGNELLHQEELRALIETVNCRVD
jgi:hypothetical protein